MTAFRAFGDERKRASLIADIDAKGPIYAAWLTRESVAGDISLVSDDYGLHPAFARLLPCLGAFGEAEDARPFYGSLFDAIPTGADTGALAREAVLLAWTDPTYGRSKIVPQGAVREACEGVVALVRQSIDAPVDRKAWRAARTRLLASASGDAGLEKTVDLMMSLAWDLDQAPGAAQDVMVAWTAGINAEADASDEDAFSLEEGERFEIEMNKINEEAMEALAQSRSMDSIGVEEFLEVVDRIWVADPVRNDLRRRSRARRERSNAKMAVWRAAIQKRVLEIADRSFAQRTDIMPEGVPPETLDLSGI
ncbi:hypothetical protein [Novosphingobium taihuense]|uniref:Uncharacterized protein n=1 Tax=Novosphingobium taihuense TaxID=260085 RepID=A0A7W7A7L9_9SPHN|nr:hypothetical protein [Novosphingobium taihuense]MBB4611920.1 hypothetical protein [Novosphingobium taihuense]TWH88726.1 hypothetical protein IQ25_00849 [Novosphingobium taihuense]